MQIIPTHHLKKYLHKAIGSLLTVSLLVVTATAQTRYTASGTIRDKSSGEVLIGASVSLQEVPRSGILSNAYGFYSISAPAATYHLLISFSGFQTDTIEIQLNKDLTLPIELAPGGGQLTAVVVSATRKNEDRKSVV